MDPQTTQMLYGSAAAGATAAFIGVPFVSKEMAYYLAVGAAVPWLYNKSGLSAIPSTFVPLLSAAATYGIANYTTIGYTIRAM